MDLQPCLVRPGLYLSSLQTEVYREILDEHGITHILQVGAELQPTHLSRYKYLQLPVCDLPEQDIVKCFSQAFDFIDSALAAGGAVLVHCQAGVSRSATVVIGYCMWKDKLSLDVATEKVTRARSIIWPNPGFKCQLRQFEALSCDPSKWIGWDGQKYLSMQYGDESVVFMSHMLGSPAADSLLGSGCRTDPTRGLHRADAATAGPGSNKENSMHIMNCTAAAGVSTAASSNPEPDGHHSTNDSLGSDNRSDSHARQDSSGSHSSKASQLKGKLCSISGSRKQQSRSGLLTSATDITPVILTRALASHRISFEDSQAAAAAADATAAADGGGGAAAAVDATNDGVICFGGKSSSWLDREAALMMAG